MSLPAGALAGPTPTFSQIFSFGDSLSDAGNASIATGDVYPGSNYATRTVPGVPFAVGYYTDGPNTTPATTGPTGLWIDQLAADLNVTDPVPALAPAGGTNYAVGAAMTGQANAQDMGNQLALFATQHPTAPATALYTLWGGANDLLAGNSPAQAADNIETEIEELAQLGARDFLWLNLPPLGDTPEGSADAAALNTAAAAFNAEWSKDLNALHAAGLPVVGVDVNALFDQMLANPTAFGFQNTTDPAQGLSNVDPNTYLFWDDIHPTTAADADIATLALGDLTAALPEPTSLTLLTLAAAPLLTRRFRRPCPRST